MSYNDESDQRAHQQPGADPTEPYQATAEWDVASEEGSWDRAPADGDWQQPEPPLWEQHEDRETWDASEEAEWDEAPDATAGGVTGAKQSIAVAADKITRWFAGLDRRPEYDDQVRGADPVAEVEPVSANAERTRGVPARDRGASSGSLAAASRAAAENRRRSVAASREGAPSAGGRGSAHAARGLRGGDRRSVAPAPVDEPVDEPLPELMGGDGSSRFPVAPLGYNRQAVDEQVAELERELTHLREALAQESHREAADVDPGGARADR